MMNGMVPIVAWIAMPFSATAAEAATAGDITETLVQLGIGGAFVAFGAAIYRRFENRGDARDNVYRAEIEAVRAEARKNEHELQRQLIEALKQSRPSKYEEPQ